MSPRHHTIILVPHTRARFRKWRVSDRQLIVGALVILLLAIVSAFTTWSFLMESVDQAQLAELAAENERLREVNLEFEGNLRQLKERLAEFEKRTRQLAIVAGLEATDLEQEAGVGGGDPMAAKIGLERRLQRLGGGLSDVESTLDRRATRLSSTPSISPVSGLLTSGYGYRRDPLSGRRALHRAIDISTAPGRPVVASADGVVLAARRSGRLGNAVIIAHGFGTTTRYGHLATFAVEAGEHVRRGQVVGTVGNTGRTTGYHLHYEVRVDGKPVNPLIYMLDRRTARL